MVERRDRPSWLRDDDDDEPPPAHSFGRLWFSDTQNLGGLTPVPLGLYNTDYACEVPGAAPFSLY